PWKILHAFNEWSRRDCDPQFCTPAAGFISRASDCEIQVHGNFVRQHHCQIGNNGSFACRQNDGDSFIRKFFSQTTAERCSRAEQFSAAQLCGIDSFDDCCREWPSFQTAHAVFGKMAIQRWPAAETEFAQLE